MRTHVLCPSCQTDVCTGRSLQMAFIKDITLSIPADEHGGPERVEKILALTSCTHKRQGSCFKVSGTFEELEKLVKRLLSAERPSSGAHRWLQEQTLRASAHVRPVIMSQLILDYIQQRCPEKLNRIQGDCFLLETLPDTSAAHGEPHGTVQVTFRPRGESSQPHGRVHLESVRRRFITFYQRTASDLQVTSVHLGTRDLTDLRRAFPHLLLKPHRNGCDVTVTGIFAHVAKLEEFLSQRPSSSKSPLKASADLPSSQPSGSSQKQPKRPEDELCPICMEPMGAEKKKVLQCKHAFCRGCLKTAFNYKPVCPICGKVYGTLRGTQPEGGTMNHTSLSSSLPGYEKYETIVIHYHIPSGIQKEEHPNPGQPFTGASRTAYLPDNSEGRLILNLLKQAFNQRLTFTIGQSTTSGRSNMVTWNDIHHKTSTHGGPSYYGYPDPDYLGRVRDELKVKGIE